MTAVDKTILELLAEVKIAEVVIGVAAEEAVVEGITVGRGRTKPGLGVKLGGAVRG